jgi:RNase adapter protein RapZ
MRGRRLFVISGISGAGKSQALKCFEDLGFFCVDNLPIPLFGRFADFLVKSKQHKDVALGVDIRGGEQLAEFSGALGELRGKGLTTRTIFLDASDEALIERFSETRHRHPLGINVAQAIREERPRLAEIKGMADKVIDTSNLTLGELKEQISIALEARRIQEMHLSVLSFGYKYGIPMDADLVMDVRFLPNPNYVSTLKYKTGLSPAGQKYILRYSVARTFLKRYASLVMSLLPHYVREGKSYLTLAIGCTGGRHRSVFVAQHLVRAMERAGYHAREFHRDIFRRAKRA